MGMIGIVFVRSAEGHNRAYNSGAGLPNTNFDREFPILLGEIWTTMHDNGENIQETVHTDYNPDYFTLNGRVYPQTVLPNGDPSLPNQPISSLIQVNAGDRGLLRTWSVHIVAAGLVSTWIVGVCGMSLGLYVLAFALPGTSLMLIRSFCEHRAEADFDRRTAVVDGQGPFALLFLNNNLHAAHHEHPQLAWYALPAYWRQHRGRLLAANGDLLYRGYGDVFSRFLLRPHDCVQHPLGRAPRRTS